MGEPLAAGTYAEFLASKRCPAVDHGHRVEPGELHPNLFDWQAAVTAWAIRRGRAAIFADCGLGKTFMQVEWARRSADRTLILAPLSVARQTVREAAKLDCDVTYVRSQRDVTGPGVWVTNYEMAHRFDAASFGAVVLDESSLLKNVDGRTRRYLTRQWAVGARKLCCTATPAPNDVTELCNHAEFLGAMTRPEMLAHYFVNDEFHGRTRWRLKGHARERFYEWMADWTVALRRPSDLGWPDDGYNLPALRIQPETVRADVAPVDGQLFPVLGGVGGRARVRKATASARVARTLELLNDPCRVHAGVECSQPRPGQEVSRGYEGTPQRPSPGTVRGRSGTARESGSSGEVASGEGPTSAEGDPVRNRSRRPGADDGPGLCGLRGEPLLRSESEAACGSRPRDGRGARGPLSSVQLGDRPLPGRPDHGPQRYELPDGPRSECAWIVWCGRNDEQDALTKALGDRAISIYGSLSPEAKEERLIAWIEGERPILLSKPSICGFGLNLQRAHRMVFVGLSDSYEAYYQAIRRCWRFGQTEPVDVHIVVSDLEAEIVDNVRSKEAATSAFTDGLIRHSRVRRTT